MTSVIKNQEVPLVQEESDLSQDVLQHKHLLNLVEHANIHADNLNFEQAKKEYSLIYELFKSGEEFQNSAAKSHIGQTIMLLFSKISVKNKIDKCHKLAQEKDKDTLKTALDELNTTHYLLKNQNSADTPLTGYIKENHDYYTKILSNLE